MRTIVLEVLVDLVAILGVAQATGVGWNVAPPGRLPALEIPQDPGSPARGAIMENGVDKAGLVDAV